MNDFFFVQRAKRRLMTSSIPFALALATPVLARAQVAGTGGGGPLDYILNYVQTNLVSSLCTLAIMGLGAYMWSRSFELGTIAIRCVGLYVMVQAAKLEGLIT